MLKSLACAFFCTTLLTAHIAAQGKKDNPVPAALNFKVASLEGKEVNLADYQGKVLLIVNVASECGATPQYAGLQELYSKYKNRGFVVLGFPCNQFGGQEPGDAKQIRAFCTQEYAVTFPMFAKIDVNGPKAASLYKHLTTQKTQPAGAGEVGWNFEKFLIGRDGKVIARFDTSVEPEDIASQIEGALAK